MTVLLHSLTQKFHRMLQWRYARFLLPLVVVLAAKLAGGFFLYNQLNMGDSTTYWMNVNWNPDGQNTIMISGASQGLKWPYLFLGWDSAWYLSILANGYAFSSQSYAFFPGLPLFGWLLNLIAQNAFYSLVIVSFVFGILWVPVYQLVAEEYLPRKQALMSALFLAFFPYIFLFTTVAYTEGLFLFFTSSTWLLFKKDKILPAMLLAAVAAISRPPGLLIILPIFLVILQPRLKNSFPWRRIASLSIPILGFSAWAFYCKTSIGDWFAFGNRSTWNSMSSFAGFAFNFLHGGGANALFEMVSQNVQHPPFSLASLVFILITPFLIYALYKMDKPLTIYSLVYFLAVLIGGGMASVPRFISFIFPIWLLPVSKLFRNKHSLVIVLIICIIFYAIGLFLWYNFLNGEFVA